MLRFLLLLLLILAGPPAAAARDVPAVPVVAAAASLRYALDEAAVAFTTSTGQSVRITYAASGNLVQQIRAGTPAELFLSADEAHVLLLADEGRTVDRGRVYAVGRLVLMAPNGSRLHVDPRLEGLRRGLAVGSVKRLAIANPDTAPYGTRAREALRHAGLWAAAGPALVTGDNIGQAFQFATTGGADGGFVSLSLVLAPAFKGRGRYALIPQAFHAPLTQRMVLLNGAGPTARRFHNWLLSTQGQAILRRHGYGPPGSR